MSLLAAVTGVRQHLAATACLELLNASLLCDALWLEHCFDAAPTAHEHDMLCSGYYPLTDVSTAARLRTQAAYL